LNSAAQDTPGEELGLEDLHSAYSQLKERFDELHGGFSQAPKFPTPHNLFFLLRYWKRTGEEEPLRMVESTLSKMRCGGVFDHLGFGFHRYSTDRRWLVPHFEKMLYDQALLALACLETFQAAGKKRYAEVAREIFTYVLRDLKSPEGGFYCAEDADSEGEEGKFYLWTEDEIRRVLDPPQAEAAIRAFNVQAGGNFTEEATGRSDGRNILHLRGELPEICDELDLDPEELEQTLEAARVGLFEHRERRIHPGKDTKILTDWNGLMIAALARGAKVLGERSYAEQVGKSGRFCLALAGGTTPRRLYETLAQPPYADRMPWNGCHFFFSDERFLPYEHVESNYGMAARAMFDRVALPDSNIHPMPTEAASAAEAARSCERELKEFFAVNPHAKGDFMEEGNFPRFDMVLLGVGQDGHTASLFPASPALKESSRWVMAVEAPENYAARPRLTLTLPLINSAACVVFMAAGEGKKKVLEEILGPQEPGEPVLPAGMVRPAQGDLISLVNIPRG